MSLEMKSCPCQSHKSYEGCCQPFHTKQQLPPSAEALMRSRYTAYVLGDIDYILETTEASIRKNINPEDLQDWANNVTWKRLEVLESTKGLSHDSSGIVEFKAYYTQDNREYCHHERSRFVKINKQWFYVDGITPKPKKIVNSKKVARNSPCPCGSGKKYKLCHGRKR
ncbi:MAG: YchJ family protein [Saprospiraceae bacterium]|nr:YchJ family protein [Saprospiraceae bacterium]